MLPDQPARGQQAQVGRPHPRRHTLGLGFRRLTAWWRRVTDEIVSPVRGLASIPAGRQHGFESIAKQRRLLALVSRHA